MASNNSVLSSNLDQNNIILANSNPDLAIIDRKNGIKIKGENLPIMPAN